MTYDGHFLTSFFWFASFSSHNHFIFYRIYTDGGLEWFATMERWKWLQDNGEML